MLLFLLKLDHISDGVGIKNKRRIADIARRLSNFTCAEDVLKSGNLEASINVTLKLSQISKLNDIKKHLPIEEEISVKFPTALKNLISKILVKLNIFLVIETMKICYGIIASKTYT